MSGDAANPLWNWLGKSIFLIVAVVVGLIVLHFMGWQQLDHILDKAGEIVKGVK